MALSNTPIGPNGEGVILIEIEGRKLGLDGFGNIIQNGALTGPENQGAKTPRTMGPLVVYGAAISIAKGGSANHCSVSLQVQDCMGNALQGVYSFDLYLSDAATGIGLTATTASGGIAALASSGTVLGALTTSKAISVTTNAAGLFILDILDTAKTGFYVCVARLAGGIGVQVSPQLTTANYA